MSLSHYPLRTDYTTILRVYDFNECLASGLTGHIPLSHCPLRIHVKTWSGRTISKNSEPQGSQRVFLFLSLETMLRAYDFNEFRASGLTRHISLLTTLSQLIRKPCSECMISINAQLQGSQDTFLFLTTLSEFMLKICSGLTISMNSELQGSQSIFIFLSLETMFRAYDFNEIRPSGLTRHISLLTTFLQLIRKPIQSVWFQWMFSFRPHRTSFSFWLPSENSLANHATRNHVQRLWC